jgi:hypothetical protein
MVQPRYNTSAWRPTRGVSTELRLLLLVITVYSGQRRKTKNLWLSVMMACVSGSGTFT